MGCRMIFSNISSIDPGKGLLEFVCAVERLSERSDLLFEIVGKASEVNRPFERRLKETIVQKGLESSIVMRGFVEDIGTYLEGVDVLVLSSTVAEALPTVIIEALAKGKIVIATDVGGVREIVDESYGNVVVPPGDCDALREAIIRVATYGDEKCALIAKRNREVAKEKFSLRGQVEAMQRVYMEICRK